MPLDCLSATFPSRVCAQLLSECRFAAKREAVPEQFRFGNAKDFGRSLFCWWFSDRFIVKIAVTLGGQSLESNN